MIMNFTAKPYRRVLSAMLALLVALAGLFGGWAPGKLAAADAPASVIVMEDFENGLDGQVRFDIRRSFSGSMTLESDPEFVRSGSHSVRLDYDFIGVKENPSYVYVGPSTYTIPIEGYPKKVGMWVYGNNDGHEIYSKFRDGNNKSFEVEYLDPAVGVNWTGWKYIEAPMPQDKTGPLVMEIYMRIEQSNFTKKNKGAVWVDDVRFVYDDNLDEDMQNPTLQVISPLDGETIASDQPVIELGVSDEKSGVEPSSIKMLLDGVEVSSAYDADANLIRYMPDKLAGGYHTVQTSVTDKEGNPAKQTWSFRIEGGPEYRLAAPSEVMSNKAFSMELQLKNQQSVTGAYAKLKFDPEALEIVGSDSLLPSEQIAIHQIDNDNGFFEFGAHQLEGDASISDRTLVTLLFKVKASARMERGETTKSIEMVDGSLQDTSGALLQASTEPHAYAIKFPYRLDVQGVSLNTISTLLVTDDTGAPVQGASIATPDIFGAQGYVTVNAAESIIYSKDKVSSDPLLTAASGDQLLAGDETTSDTFYTVYLPDGSAKGWMLKTDASYKPLSEELGTTDEHGKLRTSLLTLALTSHKLQAVKGDAISEENEILIVPQLGTNEPTYVNLFVTASPKTEQSIVWQTAPRVEQTFIQYAKNDEFASFDQSGAMELEAQSSLLLVPKNVGEIRYHKTLLTGLEPGTAYRYRVGYPGHWSAEHVFTTEPEQNAPFSFLFVTDSHTNSENGRTIFRNLMDQALEDVPDTRFVMHGGDVVDDGGVFAEWNNYLMAAESFSASIPSAYTMGNHDVKNGGKQVFTSTFAHPENGMEDQIGLTYTFNYGDAHFIVLNSEADEIDMAKQAAWLREDLKANKKKWTFASFHRTPYHTEIGRGEELVTRYIAPVLEEFKVDLVLVGHDHALAWTYPMQNGKPVKDGGDGTVYLVGGASGWKFYDAFKHDYLQFLNDDNVPVYSSIHINGDKLTIQARSESGDLLGEKVIEKRKPTIPITGGGGTEIKLPGKTLSKGDINKLIESNTLEIVLDDTNGTLNLPIDAAELLTKHPLKLKFGMEMVTLTPELLAAAAVSPGEWNGIRIVISQIKVHQTKDPVQVQAATTYKAAGNTIEVAVGVVNTKGEWKILNTKAPIVLTMTPNADADNGLIGLYSIGANGKATYVRSVVKDGAIQAVVDGNGQYSLMEYHAIYSDVREGHWASRIIAEMSAQHLVNGVDADRFQPERQVTRAEFVAMLVRKLGLEDKGSGSFSDVAKSAWYAEATAAAFQAKLVKGNETSSFRPNDYITREEIAVIMVRAYELIHGELAVTAGSGFNDMDKAADWAAEAIQKAKQIGLIEGYKDGGFHPDHQATRAESAKLVHLLKLK